MRKQYALLAAAFMVPALAQADEATVKEVHDAPAVKGSIIANLLENTITHSCFIPMKITICFTPTPAT